MQSSHPLWAVVPVKTPARAKRRLAPVLSAQERRELFLAMAEDVVSVLATVTELAGLMVVTRDAGVRRMAERYGARVLVEKSERGHTAATLLGAGTLAAEGARGMIQLPADIPLVTAEEVRCVLAAHAPLPPAITLVPARDGRGSNAVACSPPDTLPLAFGDDSFAPHLAAARARAVEPRVLRQPGIGLDIDTPADLESFAARPSPTRTWAYVERSGLARRLGAAAGD